MAMDRIFYIPQERMLEKHVNIPPHVKQNRLRTLCRAIRDEAANVANDVNVQFTIEDNQTVRFNIHGVLEQISVVVALLERHLNEGRCQNVRTLPDNVAPLTMENLQRHNRALTKLRQFSCQPCNRDWWKKVFQCKPVSRCNRCHVRYDAIPLDRVFGWGRFTCPCGNVFTGRAQAGVRSNCHQCGVMVLPDPDSIGPRRHDNIPGRGRRLHACQLCDFGRIRPCPGYNLIPYFSQPHVSTGSTASTFLTEQSFNYRGPVDE